MPTLTVNIRVDPQVLAAAALALEALGVPLNSRGQAYLVRKLITIFVDSTHQPIPDLVTALAKLDAIKQGGGDATPLLDPDALAKAIQQASLSTP